MEGVTVHAVTGHGVLTATLCIDTEIVLLSQGASAIEVACDKMKRQLLAQFREAHPNAYIG